jgi:hypothetical protein
MRPESKQRRSYGGRVTVKAPATASKQAARRSRARGPRPGMVWAAVAAVQEAAAGI